MWLQRLYGIPVALLLICLTEASDEVSTWRWSCVDRKCERVRNDAQQSEPVLSLDACKMFCNDYGLLWPKPTGGADLGNFFSKVNSEAIDVRIVNAGRAEDLLNAAANRFKKIISQSVPNGLTPRANGKAVSVFLVNNNPDLREFSLDMDESYSIKVSPASSDRINVTVTGNTFFGVRHGLETVAQLIVYDDIRNQLLIVRDVVINDKPVYPYRGLHLDTARTYFSVESIKRTIDAMAAVKLNTFHWHITDSQSFPFVSERRPTLSKLGAFGPQKIYTMEQIRELVEFGLERGVRVMPEYDAPAHVGEGWQDTDLTVCFKAEPWASYCVQPPCGQFNPTRDELYDYLEDIYQDMADVFQSDIFHMGGDEVSEQCWNSSREIQEFMVLNGWDLDTVGFHKLWDYFQTKAQDRAYKAFGKKLPIILWSSTLTDSAHIENYLNKDDYIIQMWDLSTDPHIKGLLSKGYRLIMTNHDALYFDCGFGAWVGTGNNWCSPYIGWQKVYDNSPARIAGEYHQQIIGGSSALWSEQADSGTVDSRLWPRAAALAERLWAEPTTDWRDAEYRMLHVRERLVRMGIQADSLQPEWCYQNQGYCYA